MHADCLPAAAARIVLERRQQIGTAEADRGQETEQHAHQQAEAARERGAGRIEVDLFRHRAAQVPSGDRRDAEQDERADPAGDNRQQDRLKKQMLDQPSSAGAERRPDAQFAAASRPADQHHARDVQADDQEHRAREAKKNADHAPRVRTLGCTLREVRLDGGGLEFVRRRILLRQSGRDSRHQAICARHVNAGVEPAMDANPVGGPAMSKTWIRREPRMPLERQEDERRR